MKRALLMLALCLPAVLVFAGRKHPVMKDAVTASAENLSDPFAAGWMLVDTNGDGIADAIVGKIVVPDHSSAWRMRLRRILLRESGMVRPG